MIRLKVLQGFNCGWGGGNMGSNENIHDIGMFLRDVGQ